MTHVPPQFRIPKVLIDEWRHRADEYRLTDPAVAQAYDRCAAELWELDVHTESGTDGRPLYASRMDVIAPWLAASALGFGIVGFAREVTRRRRRSSRLVPPKTTPDGHSVTPPHGDKLLRSTGWHV
jgi:hypothetical protein